MPDLSGEVVKLKVKTIHGLEKTAVKHAEEGQYSKAQRALRKAAEFADQLVKKVGDRSQKQRFRKMASKFREQIDKLEDIGDREARAKTAPKSRGSSKGSSDSGMTNKESGEDNETSETVSGLIHRSNVTFEDIGGLSETKREIKYALGMGLAKKRPGITIESWKNWLFYGPPGTGKTLLAAATSNALKLTDNDRAVFFNVKVSSVMSKYFGESAKIISELYETARNRSPAVIFLDEFESICGSRGDEKSGAERRILSTVLSELDGLSEKGRDDLFVLTIAATNRPWDLDPAILSRFDKKICIPLPDPESRAAILKIMITKRGFELRCDIDDLVPLTEGLSGREIDRLVKEVTNRMVLEENSGIPGMIDEGLDRVRDYEVRVRPLTYDDFDRARKRVNPVTSTEEMERYAEWKESDD